MPTTRTGLRCVPGVDFDHLDTPRLGLVGQERLELGKAPGMHTALSFAFTVGDTLADMGQLLKHDGRTRGGMLNKAFGEHVVVVFSLPKQLARKLFQVPFGRFGAFFLQLTTQAENAAFLLFPAALTQEGTSGGDSWSGETKIHPDHFLGWCDGGGRQPDHNVEKVMPVTETQVSRADPATDILRGMPGDGNPHLNAPGNRGQAACHALPLDPVRTLVVADRDGQRVGSLNGLEFWRLTPQLPGLGNQLRIASSMFLLPGQRTFDSLGGFDTSGAHQLSRQVRKLCAQGIVGLFMQLY